MPITPFGACPSPLQMAWYRRRTAFVHFGINTFYGTEWGDGTEDPARFAPTHLDCRQWIRELKAAGFDTVILTAKHHDGFCLWPSAVTDHSVRRSPYKEGRGDVVREFTDACREYGVKPGLYLSPWDRHEPCWGTEAYNDFYTAQLTELMTGYGPIYECWWDGAGSDTAPYDWERWAAVVRRHQPECVIFGSWGAAAQVDLRWVGNEAGRAGDPCWGTVKEQHIRVEDQAALNTGDPEGDRYIPAECDTSIRPGWFYHPEQDAQVKTPGELVHYWFTSVGRNAGILLNLPADTTGRLHSTDVAAIQGWQERLQALFAQDLAANATVTFSSPSQTDQLLFVPAPGDGMPTVTYTFSQKTEVGCFVLSEAIEYGHRIRRFAVEALVDGRWITLADKACVGYCRAEYFPAVNAEAVRLRLTDCAATPLLRRFSLYGDVSPYLEERRTTTDPERDLAAAPSARVIPDAAGVRVELGGIFPYNTVAFDATGVGAYTVEAFNGTSYEPVFKGEGDGRQVCRFTTQEASYQLRITAAKPITVPVKVFYR